MPSVIIGKVKGDKGDAGVSPIVNLEENESILTITVTDAEGTKSKSINTQENVQSDWNTTDTALDSFIKNKPEIPSKVSQLENDSNYLTDYTETDPTVPAWAKNSTKPEYTAVEVGALSSDITHLSGDVPITRKINDKTLNTDITLTASDVGALPSDTTLADFNISVTAEELNYVSGVTSNIQNQLNAKASTSHGEHVIFTTTAPNANGTASAGSATTVSRSDHVHPLQTDVSGSSGSCTGNSATATKATQDESGNNIKASYGSTLEVSTNNKLTLKSKSGATLSTVDLSEIGGGGSTKTFAQSDEPAVSTTEDTVWLVY